MSDTSTEWSPDFDIPTEWSPEFDLTTEHGKGADLGWHWAKNVATRRELKEVATCALPVTLAGGHTFTLPKGHSAAAALGEEPQTNGRLTLDFKNDRHAGFIAGASFARSPDLR